MASNEYYTSSLLDHYSRDSPRIPSPASFTAKPPAPKYLPYSANNSAFASNTSLPSYTSRGRPDQQDDSRYYQTSPERNERMGERSRDRMIPLKHTHNVLPSQDSFQSQDGEYPPSPESQKGPSLLPHPTPMKKEKKGGFFTGRIPWVVFIVSFVQISVFIGEIIKNSIVTGSPIMIHPQFNPMIGPSTYILINMGARFVPCMRTTPGVQNSNITINWPCPNSTSSLSTDPSNQCDLSALCGFSMTAAADANPNQWFRFIVPMFLHAGIIHIGFNMLLQLTMGREMELAIGSIRFALVYFSSGIFGFVLGGNFAATAIASTGASGCLFGILALTLLDLIYCWKERPSPVSDLMWILCDVLISFVLGLLPGLDNFSHIGGFLMGLVAGICILHSPNVLRQRIGETTRPVSRIRTTRKSNPAKSPMITAEPTDMTAAAKDPVGFFKGRKPLWWAWWLIRAGALIGVLVGFVVLLNNFYKYRDTCSWCKYLSCLPINNWCNIGNLHLTSTNTTANRRRELLSSAAPVLVEELWRKAM